MAITPEMARAELARRELAKRQGQQPSMQQQSQGIGSIPGDIASMGANALIGAGEKAMQLPQEIGSGISQIAENPLSGTARAGGGFLSGLAEGGKQIFNLPLSLGSYLGEKGVPGFASGFPFADSPRTLGQIAEGLKIGDTGIQKKLMGERKPGDEIFEDVGQLASLFVAPEAAGVRAPAITSRGITRQLSRHKAAALDAARADYGQLFQEASSQGLTHAIPSRIAAENRQIITSNSRPIHHRAYNEYLQNPTLENAHWAQSELGALVRHLDSIANKSGLTPIQHQTLRSANQVRNEIRNSMFDNNVLGSNPQLAERYRQLTNQYRENVIPYTRLEALSETEAGRMRPKTAIKDLMKDEQFMIDLSRNYPGLLLHTPTARNIALGASGLLGYDELKKLLKGG